jgi:hypothetical protein
MFRRLGYFGLLIALAAGCSAPPTKEHDQAQAALAAARAAEAAIYAPDDLQAAQDLLDRYDQAVDQHDYRAALGAAIDARDRAYEAARQAGVQKAASQAALQSAIADLEALVKSATTRLSSTTGPRLTAASADRLRAATQTAQRTLQETRSAQGQQKFRDGLRQIEPVTADLRKTLASLDAGRRGRGAF